MFDIVLHRPEIPPNAGNVIRLAANTGARLHLVRPLGFSMDNRQLKRAGLNYHEYASVRVHPNWQSCLAVLNVDRLFAFTTKARRNAYDDSDPGRPAEVPLICRNKFEGLCELSQGLVIKKIVVSFREKRSIFPTQELLRCRVGGIDIIEGNSFYEMLTGKLLVEFINPSWLIFSNGFQKSRMRRIVKRAVDLILSSAMLIALSPLLLLVAVAIKLDSPGPVFFSQMRVGERHPIYRMHKFRSMAKDAEKLSGPVWAQKNDPRVSRVGRFLRRFRIDELPQLWNVLKGEMSFVGPRPEREEFVQELEGIVPYYRERFSVKPGITGWAQVNFGYCATIRESIEKLNYDFFYIKNMSNLMDLLVMLRTVKILLFGHGVR